jgi:hypothetical protein
MPPGESKLQDTGNGLGFRYIHSILFTLKVNSRSWWIIFLLALIGVTACDREPNVTPVRGAVLRPGEIVEARNRNGKVRISYAGAEKRRYE